MLNSVLLGLILLSMSIPIAIIGTLGLALKGVRSVDLSVFDLYVVMATTHALAVLIIAEAAVIVAAAYLTGYTQVWRFGAMSG